MSLTLVIGGTRSGKSAHGERLAAATGLPVRYVATADGGDPSMHERIRAHATRRPERWTTVDAGPRLAESLAEAEGMCVLVDGLGPWIATALHRAGAFASDDRALLRATGEAVLAEVDRAVPLLRAAAAAVVVAEQAGEGVLPADAASRAWVDLLGDATQRLAAAADRVDLVVAGRALTVGAAAGAPAVPADPSLRRHGDRDVRTGRAPDPADPSLRRHGDRDVRPRPAPEPADPSLRRHGDRDVRPGDADHAVNVVAGGAADWLREALDRALDGAVARYPDEDAAVAALAALHGRAPEEIVPTNGATEALWLLGPAFRPALAACVHPGFTESEAALHAFGIPVVRVQRDPAAGFALDPAAVPDAADLVVVGHPASPSGTLDPASALLALRRPGRVVVVDEAFMDLVPGEPGSLVRERLEDVVVVRSLTKVLAIPGLRVGYAVAAPQLAARLRAVRPAWSANALALAALTAAAARPDALAAIAAQVAEERADLAARLAGIPGVRVWPGAANFVLIEVADGPAVVAALRAAAIAVRPAASFPGLGPGHIRVTARDPTRNARLAGVLAEAVP